MRERESKSGISAPENMEIYFSMKIQNTWQILFPAFENDVSLDKREFLKWSPIFLKNICQQLTLRISNKKKKKSINNGPVTMPLICTIQRKC